MALSKIASAAIQDASVAADDLAAGVARANFGAGAVLQVIQSTDATVTSFSNADGTFIEVAITPASTSNKILVSGAFCWSGDNPNGYFALERSIGGGAWTGLGTISGYDDMAGGVDTAWNAPVNYLDSPTTVAQVRYRVYWYHITKNGGVMYRNRSYTGSTLTVPASRPARTSLIAQEIAG